MPVAPTLVAGLTSLRPRWSVPAPADPAVVERLSRELNLPPLVAGILARRGHATSDDARSFLRPSKTQLHSPRLMAGMVTAAERLATAVSRNETILVHGDYDVDGICATALLTRALRMMGARVVPFVPHRLLDGYDLERAGLAAAASAGARVIVTVDCGIVAHGAVECARFQGLDVIVTDHHTPGQRLPPALAVVNPNRRDCAYPDKSLAGAGVAYKLALAVAEVTGFPEERLYPLLDLVAIATVADLAPVTAENRAILRWGLSILARTPNPGLRALLRSSGLGDREAVTAGQIGFVLAPRLNAAGRLGDAMRGVRLLLTDEPREAEAIALELEQENKRRRELDEATLNQVLRRLEREFDHARDRGVVLASADWHPGIIGIVASRVVERIHRPTVLIALGPEEGKGSGRSVRGFHLYEAFAECADHLIRFGGHRAAAGCAIHPDRVEAFRAAFDAAAARALTEDLLVPEVAIDAEIGLGDATIDLCRLLKHFGPFGIGNPAPLFGSRRLRLASPPKAVGGRHLKLLLSGDDAFLPAIGFGMADRIPELGGIGSFVDAAYRLEEHSWEDRSGRRRLPELQARLVDVRRST